MKRLLILLLVWMSVHAVAGPGKKSHADKHPLWHSGTVVLRSGDTLHCQLNFTRKVAEGLLQVMNGNQIHVLTVKDVISFSYFDEKKNIERKYLTLSLRPDLSTRRHEVFIEHVYGSKKLSILNHKTLGFATTGFQFNPFKKKVVVNYRYLLDNQSGEILPMSRENALQLMKEEKKQILTYIQTNGMRLKTVKEFIVLLDYHDSLSLSTF
jgi:hypothetical protein